MKNFLFYKRDNGAGAVGVIEGNTFRTVQSFKPGAFATNWSHIEPTPNGLLFYNEDTGETALGNLSWGDFKTTTTFPAGFLAPAGHIFVPQVATFFFIGSLAAKGLL